MKIFFHNYKTRQGIPSDDPQHANITQALEIFSTLSSETENYFGMIDDADKTIQFVLEANNRWLVDIPNPPEFINDQQFATDEECIEILIKLFERNKIVSFYGMKKVNILEETLEEIITSEGHQKS